MIGYGWIIVAVIAIPLIFWFVLPKMSGFVGDIANIIKAAIRIIFYLCCILAAIAFITSVVN